MINCKFYNIHPPDVTSYVNGLAANERLFFFKLGETTIKNVDEKFNLIRLFHIWSAAESLAVTRLQF
jgi:hypothetical protein